MASVMNLKVFEKECLLLIAQLNRDLFIKYYSNKHFFNQFLMINYNNL